MTSTFIAIMTSHTFTFTHYRNKHQHIKNESFVVTNFGTPIFIERKAQRVTREKFNF